MGNKHAIDDGVSVVFYMYQANFFDNYDLLLSRYMRFCEIRDTIGRSLDLDVYVDMIFVQLRALLCDNHENLLRNYTIKNWLKLIGDKEGERKLNELLKKTVPGWNSIRAIDDEILINRDTNIEDAIRIIANRTICHYDNLEFNREEHGQGKGVNIRTYSEGYLANLRYIMYNKNCDYGIDYIIHKLAEILHVELN